MVWTQILCGHHFRRGVDVEPSVSFVYSRHIHHTDGSIAAMVIYHHHTEHRRHHHHHRALDKVTNFPAAMSYSASEAAKIDIAAIFSGSVVEDIDISSIM